VFKVVITTNALLSKELISDFFKKNIEFFVAASINSKRINLKNIIMVS
jgi:hypothetical protein